MRCSAICPAQLYFMNGEGQYIDYPEGRINDYGGGMAEGYHPGMVKIIGKWFRRDRFKFRAYIK